MDDAALLHEVMVATRRAFVPLPDTRVVERPGWMQLVTPSLRGGGMNEVRPAARAPADVDAVIDAEPTDLKIMPVENGSGWVRPLIEDMNKAYEFNPHIFDEHPVEVLKRNIYVHPFHEEDTQGLIDVIGVDNVVFGSDYPHPEGMADPISFVDELEGLPAESVAKVMGGNLGRLLDVA